MKGIFELQVQFLFYISPGGKLMLVTNYVSMKGDYVIVESGGLIDATAGGYTAGRGPGSGSGNTG